LFLDEALPINGEQRFFGAQNLDSRRRVFRQVGQRTGVRNQTRADKVSDERL
jgi:hypothetical protein